MFLWGKERFSRKRCLLALLSPTVLASLARRSVAITGRLPLERRCNFRATVPLCGNSATGSGRFFSLSHREVFLACSKLSLRQRKKGAIGTLCVGGEGEIRTLEPLLTVTRFPIVRARPATRLLRICSAFNFQFYQRLKYNITKLSLCQPFFEKYFLFYKIRS